MIVRIEPTGTSFLGAGRYYLHDKQTEGETKPLREQTDERVWFTDTRNCLNIDPERALEEMWMTAEMQAELKMLAGVSRGGRRCTEPVKTISLSWHKDDRPDGQHMVESADAFLKHMGWDTHQAVYVAHRDTEHRHIHIILNRVDGETGRTLDDYKERKRAQAWALSYEKEHEAIRCEERELRAAKREGRAPELDAASVAAAEASRTQQDPRTAANDHLPHNVVQLSRQHQKSFEADEQARAKLDEQERAELKAYQRAEREQFFRDGAKLFKATRHAAYDEVRREFKQEWKDYYADEKLRGTEAEAASKSGVDRALFFAREGRWDDARAAFADRDAVRSEIETELALRMADILDRQKQAIAERQRDACDALRAVRDVQYQELLERQRSERAAFAAGTTLEGLGIGATPSLTSSPAPYANENGTVTRENNETRRSEIQRTANLHEAANVAELQTPTPEVGSAPIKTAANDIPHRDDNPSGPLPEAAPITRQISDLAAGAIGSVASYLADELGEAFAPTPPEVREANAKAEAKRAEQRHGEQPALDEKTAPYARIIDEAIRTLEEDRTKDEAYWRERDRGKDWERDR